MIRFAKALCVVAALLLSSCLNLLSPFDGGPSNDPQFLSAGRSCFDRGDYACATQNFSKLSSASAETAAAENAFVILQQAGAGSQAFISAFGTTASSPSAVGAALNKLSSYFASNANLTTRLAVFSAYQQVQNIPTTGSLRGLVRFASAASFLAEVLAEVSATPGNLKQADFVSNSTCANDTVGVCATDTACGPGSSKLVNGSARFGFGTGLLPGATASNDTIIALTNANINGSPTLDMIDAAIGALNTALGSTELGGNGGLGGNAAAFSSALQTGANGAASTLPPSGNIPNCYRFGLLSFGIGAP